MTFKEFVEQKKTLQTESVKSWSAKKDDIIKLWNSTNEKMPLSISPVPKGHKGKRFDQDGVRITGSAQFINSILAKLKSFLFYNDHPSLSLDVKYRQVNKREVSDRSSFVCYINVIQK